VTGAPPGARIGTAGWSIARDENDRFPAGGTALERYASQFRAVEINSSFHRPHRPSTWERWRDSVPDDFRFSVKIPKRITHERKLVDATEILDTFLQEVAHLGDKLGALLVQLPPKLSFDEEAAGAFFSHLGARAAAPVMCEPRHLSWFEAPAQALLDSLGISRVGADPAICPSAAIPAGPVRYRRLHGSPVIYRSSYRDRLPRLADALAEDLASGRESWCIFDNTASSAATGDALELAGMVGGG
jgi:uncharacterized protein YecE (DUF72 family)